VQSPRTTLAYSSRPAAARSSRNRFDEPRHPGVLESTPKRTAPIALGGDNLFAVLMDAVRCCTLGEITQALFEVGGRFRRNV
jgi:methylmalonyl-CoA mutase